MKTQFAAETSRTGEFELQEDVFRGLGFQRWLESLPRKDFTGSSKVHFRENTVSIALIYRF